MLTVIAIGIAAVVGVLLWNAVERLFTKKDK